MTQVGHPNPLTRLGGTIRGLIDPPKPSPHAPRPVLVIGHRGAARVAVENTIESFQRAVELGAEAIETDICVTRDGHFVLWHDADPNGKIALARQTLVDEASPRYELSCPNVGSSYRRKVAELSIEELRAHFGYTVRDEAGERLVPIALLEDLFAWADREPRLAAVFLDVKLDGSLARQACSLLELVAARAPAFREGFSVEYLSTELEVLTVLSDHVRQHPLPPRVTVRPDFELPGVVEFAKKLGLRAVSMGCGARSWPDFRKELAEVLAAREAGEIESVVTWTVNGRDQLQELVAFGVDGIITDDAPLLREVLAAVPAATGPLELSSPAAGVPAGDFES